MSSLWEVIKSENVSTLVIYLFKLLIWFNGKATLEISEWKMTLLAHLNKNTN